MPVSDKHVRSSQKTHHGSELADLEQKHVELNKIDTALRNHGIRDDVMFKAILSIEERIMRRHPAASNALMNRLVTDVMPGYHDLGKSSVKCLLCPLPADDLQHVA